MKDPTVAVTSRHSFSLLLEFAADNDVEGVKQCICNDSVIGEVGLWYGCERVSRKVVVEHRTPLMVAAKYGSVDVVKLILSLSEVDVNFSCGPDKSTALHCAASSGSINAVDVVKLLLLAGADPNAADALGDCPIDIIMAPPQLPDLKIVLEELFKSSGYVCQQDMRVSDFNLRCSFSPSLFSPKIGLLSSVSDSTLTPVNGKPNDVHVSFALEKKEYPVDPSVPDIKNSIYATDEFRMFSFKILPCSRAYSHDWTECPFVHPGENARRRDLRKFHYSCVPCPDFRKGTCRRGDLCEYAHGVFECWLHPAQYRTRLCKDGMSCTRRVCFFAHTSEELRPLYGSSGSAAPAPRLSSSSSTAMDMAGSTSAVSVMLPSPFTPPMSRSGSSMTLPPQNIPNLCLPGCNLPTGRLQYSLNARDIPARELSMLQDFEQQQVQVLKDLSCPMQPQLSISSANPFTHSSDLTFSKLHEVLSTEVLSPQYSSQPASLPIVSPSQKSVLLNQFQLQQSMLSPTNMKNVNQSLLHPSLGRISTQSVEPISPVSSQFSALVHYEKLQQQLRCLSFQDLRPNLSCDLESKNGIGSPVNSLSKWDSNGELDFSIQADELGGLHKSYSLVHDGEEPDFSWVQSLVKESPSEIMETSAVQVLGTS